MCILIYLTYDTLSSKNVDSSLCYDVIITHQKFKQLTNLVIFAMSIITVGHVFRDVIFLIINQCYPQARNTSKQSAYVTTKLVQLLAKDCRHRCEVVQLGLKSGQVETSLKNGPF